MTKNNKIKSVISFVICICMIFSLTPNIFAAQVNEYVDPADSWLNSNNRTNELDVNATTTYETQFCTVCQKDTLVLTYRVPEYTKSGETALNRGVKYSDGTKIDGKSTGNLDDGTPGVDAYYTGYHWTKSVCQSCGTINTTNGPDTYHFNNNVYMLNSCDNSFFLDFDATTYEDYSSTQHKVTLKKGEYCKFCKGTFARASTGIEKHNYTETVDAQLGNNRFYVSAICEYCGHKSTEYITAKTVVASYYGVEDGEAHTLTISDLSDSGVGTSIRYGTSANNCNLSSAPNYTQAGYYTVYYKINYTYAGESMTENGVSYVHIVDNESDNVALIPTAHEHDYHYLETVLPTCVELGYERFQCGGCGDLEKRNYKPALGHHYEDIVIKDANCKDAGLVLTVCKNCGDFYQTVTTTNEHKYNQVNHNPTCRNVGYTEFICEICGDNYINNIQPIVSHSYERITKEPTCEDRGYTTSTCTMCGFNSVSDYTEPIGHKWDNGSVVTSSTCVSEGVKEYKCLNDGCNEKMIKATSAKGHTLGKDASCTEPQICTECETVLALPLGHNHTPIVTNPTCTSMGYTTYYCSGCDNSYIGDYVNIKEHKYTKEIFEPTCTNHGYTVYTCSDCDASYVSDYVDCVKHTPSEWIVDSSATIVNGGLKHIECTVCGETIRSAELPKLADKDISDEDGIAIVGDYFIILVDENENPIFNSELTIDEEDNVSIKLNEGRVLNYKKPTTIIALYNETYHPKENLKIFIEDINGNKTVGYTDEVGHLVVPNNKTNTNDDNGTIGREDEDTKETFVITVTDENGITVSDCEIYIDENNDVIVELPDGIKPTNETPAVITVTDHHREPVKDVIIVAKGDEESIETGVTDAFGKVLIPVCNEGYTDAEGKVNINRFTVLINDGEGAVENAFVKYNDDINISVNLPAERNISHTERIYVTVLNSVSNPEKDIVISVVDASNKEYIDKTNSKGVAVFPPLTEDVTDSDGSSDIEETKPDIEDETKEETVTYKVVVTDTKGVIENAIVKIEDGKVIVTLPETHTLTTANQTTVTVSDSTGNFIKDVSVTINDITSSKSANTGANGKVTLPVIQQSSSSSRPSYSSGGGSSYSSLSVKVTDKNGKNVNVSRSNGTNISTLTLPSGKNLLKDDNYYTIDVTSSSKPKKGYVIVLKDRNGNEVKGATDEDGKLILPSTEHKAYIVGFDDGTFRPDNDMTRGEAAAIFARLISEENKEVITGTSKFADVLVKDWCSSYVAYLEGYDVICGYSDNTFKADENVTRAEFVAMAVRYYMIFNEVKDTNYKVNYTDLKENYWAYKDIAFAKNIGWLNGYADGSFKGDNNITRAEVVTVINHVTGRTPDKEYIDENVSTLNKFTDLKNNSHWGYYDIIESANDHIAVSRKNAETWAK